MTKKCQELTTITDNYFVLLKKHQRVSEFLLAMTEDISWLEYVAMGRNHLSNARTKNLQSVLEYSLPKYLPRARILNAVLGFFYIIPHSQEQECRDSIKERSHQMQRNKQSVGGYMARMGGICDVQKNISAYCEQWYEFPVDVRWNKYYKIFPTK